MTIDWAIPWTKGRQVYASTLGDGVFGNVNYDGGFLIGWDRWSDGRFALDSQRARL